MINRTDPKDVSMSLQEKRRTIAIEMQKEKRRELLQQLREIDNTPDFNDTTVNSEKIEMDDGKEVENAADKTLEVPGAGVKMQQDETEEEKERRRQQERQRRIQRKKRALEYANLIMLPEWLVETPKDLGEEWTVMARPVGSRCLVRSHNHRTDARGKDGRIMFFFDSNLPGGSPQQDRGDAILDCIWHEESQTFFVLDVIRWNRLEIGNNPWEFRSFWRESKFRDLELGKVSEGNELKFRVIPCRQSNPENLKAAYTESSYEVDGLLFYHLKSEYCSGPTPLVHLWKDSNCSKWHITSTDGINPNKHQTCALELRGSKNEGWRLESCEHLVLANLPGDFDLSFKTRRGEIIIPEEGSILKWLIQSVDLPTQTVNINKYLGLSNKKTKADLFSKLAFQFQARSGSCVTFELLEKATKSEFIDRMSGMKDLLMAL